MSLMPYVFSGLYLRSLRNLRLIMFCSFALVAAAPRQDLCVHLSFLANFSDGNSGIAYFCFLALTEISLVLVSTHENKQAGGSGGAMDQDPGGL